MNQHAESADEVLGIGMIADIMLPYFELCK